MPVSSYLCYRVFFGEDERHDCTSPKKVLDLERIKVGIVRRFVLVQHEVAGIGRGRQKDELEDSVVRPMGEVPEYICSGSCDQQRIIVREAVKNPNNLPTYRVT